MRLWHIDLITYLPNSQLVAQWRGLNSIFKKQDNHILINYIYDYNKRYLWWYTQSVINEMKNRCYSPKSWDNYNTFFNDVNPVFNLKYKEHNDEYLTICYYNLREKYIRGQKDFTADIWQKLDEFYKKEIMKSE